MPQQYENFNKIAFPLIIKSPTTSCFTSKTCPTCSYALQINEIERERAHGWKEAFSSDVVMCPQMTHTDAHCPHMKPSHFNFKGRRSTSGTSLHNVYAPGVCLECFCLFCEEEIICPVYDMGKIMLHWRFPRGLLSKQERVIFSIYLPEIFWVIISSWIYV